MVFEELLDQLVQEGKVSISKDSVVVEFLCGWNRTAARVVSKYKPKLYFANDKDPKVFDPRLFHSRACFPSEIDGMKVKFLNCDVLDVDYLVKSYDIGLFYDSLHVIDSQSSRNSVLPMDTSTYWSWLEKVKKELEQNKFDVLERYIPIENNKKSLTRWLKYVKSSKEHNIELLEEEIALKNYSGSPFNRFFNAVYVLIEKIYNSLNQKGVLLIFEKDKYNSDNAEETLGKLQKCGYIKFDEIKPLSSPSSEEVLLYALK